MPWEIVPHLASDEETAVIGRGRRNQHRPPENLLIKWRSHTGCGFNLSMHYEKAPRFRGSRL